MTEKTIKFVREMNQAEREAWLDARAKRELEYAEEEGADAARKAAIYRESEAEAPPELTVGPGSASMWRGNAERAEKEAEKQRRRWKNRNAELNLSERQRAYRRKLLSRRDVKPGGVRVLGVPREDGSVRFGVQYARGVLSSSKLYRAGGWIER